MKKIYFDYASTTPCDPQVTQAMQPFFEERFGNASSPHSIGQDAQKALEESRETVAGFIGAKSNEIIFNSGATEGNNHALLGIAQMARGKGRHVIVSAVEHHSVLRPAEFLESQGWQVTFLPVGGDGLVDPLSIKEALTDQTVLVCLMQASNEIGTIQPVEEVSRLTKARHIPLLVDACQTVGHIPVNVDSLGADLLTFSAHKFYGPKGVGALYVRPGTKIGSYLMGGDQERGRRASTQNVAAIVGMAKAALLCRQNMKTEMEQQTLLRDQLLREVPQRILDVKVNGHLKNRLPNNAHFSFKRLQSESLIMSLDMNGICASMGSACTAGAMEPSHVLRAIGLSDELALGSLRVSIGRWTTPEQIDYFLETLPGIVESLRI